MVTGMMMRYLLVAGPHHHLTEIPRECPGKSSPIRSSAKALPLYPAKGQSPEAGLPAGLPGRTAGPTSATYESPSMARAPTPVAALRLDLSRPFSGEPLSPESFTASHTERFSRRKPLPDGHGSDM